MSLRGQMHPSPHDQIPGRLDNPNDARNGKKSQYWQHDRQEEPDFDWIDRVHLAGVHNESCIWSFVVTSLRGEVRTRSTRSDIFGLELPLNRERMMQAM